MAMTIEEKIAKKEMELDKLKQQKDERDEKVFVAVGKLFMEHMKLAPKQIEDAKNLIKSL